MEIDARARNSLRWRGARAKKVWVGFSAPEVKGGAGVARRRLESRLKPVDELAGSIEVAGNTATHPTLRNIKKKW